MFILWLVACVCTDKKIVPDDWQSKKTAAEAAEPGVAAHAAPVDALPLVAEPAPGAQNQTRVVAIGDVHGDPGSLVHVLQMAHLLDVNEHWVGGTTTFVQTGDTTDRGPDSHGVLVLLRRLQAEATAAGGRVIPLLGNHEVMNMQGDWRYVSPADKEGYGGEEARKAAFSVSGEDGKWLRTLDAVTQVGDTVFCHGGVTSQWAAKGIPSLNAEIHAGIDTMTKDGALGQDGPLWFRGYLLEDPPSICPELDRALTALGAKRMVVGHTTQDSGLPASRCDGKLWGIDTGISAYYGYHYAAIEIVGDQISPILPIGK